MSSSMPCSRRIRCSTAYSALLLIALQACIAESTTFTVEQGSKIQDALDQVQPGDIINIEEGHYWEDVRTMVDGTESAPITVRGAPGTDRDDVVLRGDDDDDWRVFHVRHDFYILEDFTINGRAREANDDNYEDNIRNKLIYVLPERSRTTRAGGYKSALDGLVVRNMLIKNAGAECIRLRYFVTNAKIYDNEIRDCGIYDFVFDDGGKTGEGVYIGTSSRQWDEEWNPTDEPDVCRYNHVYDNDIETKGNEGVQVKEGSEDTVIENNRIYMQHDKNSAGVDCRGDRCIIRDNYIQHAEGSGIRLGGYKVGSKQYGVDSDVYGNTIKDCLYAGIKIEEEPQGVICGNTIEAPDDVDDEDYDFVRESRSDDYEDTAMAACPDGLSSPGESTGPSSNPSPNPSQDVSSNPSPDPVPTPENAKGCYADKSNSRIMEFAFKSPRMTNEVCALYCGGEDEEYSGTQNGHECWCGDSSSEYKEHGTATNCNLKCDGDDDEYCGGVYAMTVSEAHEYNQPDGFKGCFTDVPGRVFDDYSMFNSEMTTEMCVEFCDDKGTKYAATEYGKECFCGDTNDYDDFGRAICDFSCAGDTSEICGGRWAMTVWKVNDYDD